MKHRMSLEGYSYKLRPVKPADLQENLNLDLAKEKSYDFLLESRIDKSVIAVFNLICVNEKEVLLNTLMLDKVKIVCDEAVFLLCNIAFNELNMLEIRIDTLAENLDFLSGIKTELQYNEHLNISKTYFEKTLSQLLEGVSSDALEKELANEIGDLEFHHIGVATKNIQKELSIYTLMGYKKEDDFFEDEAQGIRGLFIVKEGHPRLELLENLQGSNTLDKQIENNQKLYHTAYYVDDIEKVIDLFLLNRAKMISPLKKSVYFKKRICFLMLPNMSMIELLER